MNGTMSMLKPISMPRPNGAVPDGLKVTALAGPNTTQSAPTCPVLAVGGFTLWPFSYYDNRVSFGMVMYDPKWKVKHQVEKKGARYVYKITMDGSGSSGTVTFWGQSDQKITMSLDEICTMMCTP